MSEAVKPIFYDERGRRWPAILRLWAALALVVSILGTAFLFSILATPLLPPFRRPPLVFLPDPTRPPVIERPEQRREAEVDRARRSLDRLRDKGKSVSILRARAADRRPMSIAVGFYVNWNPSSYLSLTQHVNALTHLAPEWLHLGRDGASIDTEESAKVIEFARAHHLPILPLLNNVADEQWQVEPLHHMLNSETAQTALIERIVAFLRRYRFRGLNLDLESAPASDRDRMTAFVRRLAATLHWNGFTLSQDIPVDDDAYDLEALGKINDFVVPMLYDEHDSSGTAGPIASQGWFEEQADRVYESVPPEKVVLGLGSYAYDWRRGRSGARSIDYEEAIFAARDTENDVRFDPASLNPHVSYVDEGGTTHDVWFLDAATLYNEIASQQSRRPLGAALWVLGSEDPSVWSIFDRSRLAKPLDPSRLRKITFARQTDFDGRGEVIDVVAMPSDGRRAVSLDGRNRIVGEAYLKYPTPYLIRQYGDQKNSIVLSFDDGPDPVWTPKILDILHRYGVPATFFVTGANAERYPDLIRREYGDGHEVGNHTYYHPDLTQIGPMRTRLEMTTTQRAIEAFTGHSTRLFRPPYTVDTSPESAAQVRPLYEAERLGYITVGANIDPNDWATPGTRAILSGGKPGPALAPNARDIREIDGVFPTIDAARRPGAEPAHIILLHDAGGDRSQTVAALPKIIEELRRRGYAFTTVSGLLGYRNRDAMMPSIEGRQAMFVDSDRISFSLVHGITTLMGRLFLLAILLSVARILVTGALATRQARRARAERFDRNDTPVVSVVIAAYNEAKVIERTIRRLLASDYPNVEIVVVDDGSIDGTADVVRDAFGPETGVRVIRKPNGGKASALNAGIEQSKGEIVVGLDADTLFAPDTITLLVRHFEDPRVAAVAGNVKVGNRINLWTLWQSLEYITSQNFDRRAFSLLNGITVVPGAVGAWRRGALDEVGGYRSDTLAEDTDLTIRVRRRGHRIVTENRALAYTEAPDSLRTLARQRFRWSYGTLQCLWKHRDTLFRRRYGALGSVSLPALWVFQIGFQVLCPIVDLSVLWAALFGNLAMVLYYYALFMGVELIGASIAIRLDREDPRLLLWLFWQRFAYRQLMYYVAARSVLAAIRGDRHGWGKLERKGTASVAETAPREAPGHGRGVAA